MNPTRRTDIKNVADMSRRQFLSFIQQLVDHKTTAFTDANFVVTEKVDGMSIKFGIDENGESFIESSYVGPVTQVGQYSALVRERYPHVSDDRIPVGIDYMHHCLKSSLNDDDLMRLSPFKIVSEALFIPLAVEISSSTVKFNIVEYDTNRIGILGSFAIIDIQDVNGERHPHSADIQRWLRSNDYVKFVYPHATQSAKHTVTIDSFQHSMRQSLNAISPDYMRILSSRSAKYAQTKQIIERTIDHFKKYLSEYLLLSYKGGVFGDEIEGLVFKCRKAPIIFKVQTPEFIGAHRGRFSN